MPLSPAAVVVVVPVVVLARPGAAAALLAELAGVLAGPAPVQTLKQHAVVAVRGPAPRPRNTVGTCAPQIVILVQRPVQHAGVLLLVWLSPFAPFSLAT